MSKLYLLDIRLDQSFREKPILKAEIGFTIDSMVYFELFYMDANTGKIARWPDWIYQPPNDKFDNEALQSINISVALLNKD